MTTTIDKARSSNRPTRLTNLGTIDNRGLAGFLADVGSTVRRGVSKSKLERVTFESVQKSAMGETSGTTGGYLVPTEFNPTLMAFANEESIILPRANTVPMKSAVVQVPVPKVTEASGAAGVSSLYGGVNFYWQIEGEQPTENASTPGPKFAQVPLRAETLIGNFDLSNDLYQDITSMSTSVDPSVVEPINNYLYRLLGKAMGWMLDYTFLMGKLSPIGITQCNGKILVTRAGGGAIANTDIGNLAKNLHPACWNRAIWVAHSGAIGQLASIANYQINGYTTGHEGSVGSIYGRPLFVTEKLPSLGSTGDLILIDPYMYFVGIRQEIGIDVSESPGFRTNQISYRVTCRFAGAPAFDAPIYLQDQTSTASPFVVLN